MANSVVECEHFSFSCILYTLLDSVLLVFFFSLPHFALFLLVLNFLSSKFVSSASAPWNSRQRILSAFCLGKVRILPGAVIEAFCYCWTPCLGSLSHCLMSKTRGREMKGEGKGCRRVVRWCRCGGGFGALGANTVPSQLCELGERSFTSS